MADFILLTHSGAPEGGSDWASYIRSLNAAGVFRGGSAIGAGACFTKAGASPPITAQLAGFIRIEAGDLAQARRFLSGHPAYEAGGVVEIRELPRT